MSTETDPALETANDAPAPSPEPVPSTDPAPFPSIEAAPAPTLLSVEPEHAPLADVPSFLAAPLVPLPLTPPAPRPRASVTFLTVVTVISLAADLASKGWAKARLSGFEPRTSPVRKVEVLKGHLDFIFAQNPGGAWSFLRSLPDSLRRPFFLVVSSAAIVFIISIYLRVYRDQTAMKWGLPLALGGAMGNLVDRIRYGWVVDFVDVYVIRGKSQHHWPTFNVADIAIVVGVALMAIDMMRSRGVRMHDDGPAPSSAPAA
jgi:signal peptidase II